MKLNYYPDTDSLYIDLSESTSVESREVSEGVVLDYDTRGNLVGIDIDNASAKVDLARKAGEVMLTRFDRVDGRGLHGLAGYIDFDDSTPDRAADLILERLALNEGHPKEHDTGDSTSGGRRLHTSTPNNLPRLQSFFGRERELAAIREALDPESRTWGALIDGPGGMGKTSLAVRAAYDCPPGQFQRIVFVSLKNCELDDDGERQLGSLLLPGLLEMLNELARELGQPDIAKAPEDQRIRLLLDALCRVQWMGMEQRLVLRTIELLAERVLPLVAREIG